MEYKRTQIGQKLYQKTNKAINYIMNHMWLYYILNYTWGLITTLLGWIVYFILCALPKTKVPEVGRFGPCSYAIVGKNWGGLELGTNFLLGSDMGESWTLHTKCHEMGHTFQNAVWGPLAIFMIYIPSAIRYWHRALMIKLGKDCKPYDSIWFEGSATDCGIFYYENYLKKKEK